MTDTAKAPDSRDEMQRMPYPPPQWRKRIGLLALCGAALSLRPPSASISPVLESIGAALQLSHSAAGLLSAIPIACMALAPPLISKLAPHRYSDRLIWICLTVTAVALALRATALGSVLFGSAVIAGVCVATIQVLLPSVIKERFENPSAVTSLYATMSTAGAGIATAATAYLAARTGSWSYSLAAWSIPILVVAILWLFLAPVRSGAAPATLPEQPFSAWRDRTGWQIAIFSGGSSLSFWCVTSWLPAVFMAAGRTESEAGLLASSMAFVQIAASFIVTGFAARRMPRRSTMIASVLLAATGCVGIALWPADYPWLWILVLGTGVGALFPLSSMLPVNFGETSSRVVAMTSMALTVGYLIAAPGPFLIGLLRDLTGAFTVPFILLAVLMLPMAFLAIPLSKGTR